MVMVVVVPRGGGFRSLRFGTLTVPFSTLGHDFIQVQGFPDGLDGRKDAYSSVHGHAGFPVDHRSDHS